MEDCRIEQKIKEKSTGKLEGKLKHETHGKGEGERRGKVGEVRR